MARSQLLRAFQRLARDHAEASRRGVDLKQVRAERAAAVIERRRFLQGAGAFAGVALVSRPRAARPQPPKHPKIVIIGAGIAGLNAALTLKAAGFASTIYESSGRVGGRMHSDTTTWNTNPPPNSQLLKSEWCGEFIDTGQTTIMASRASLACPS